MKKLTITVVGQTTQELADTLEEALGQVKLGTPSDLMEYEDGTGYDLQVQEVPQISIYHV